MGDLSCGLAGCLSSWPGYVVAGTGVGGLRCLLVGRLTRELGDRHFGRPRGLTDRVADRGDDCEACVGVAEGDWGGGCV